MPNLQFYSWCLGEETTWTSMRDICQDVEDNSFLLFLITLTFTVYPSSFISSQPSYHFILFVQFQCILCVTHTRLTNSLNIFLLLETILGFFFFFFWVWVGVSSLMAQMVKNLPAMMETCVQSLKDWRSSLQGRSSGEGNGNPLQDSCWENSMDRGAWRAIVHGVSKSWTLLSEDHTHILFLLNNSPYLLSIS